MRHTISIVRGSMVAVAIVIAGYILVMTALAGSPPVGSAGAKVAPEQALAAVQEFAPMQHDLAASSVQQGRDRPYYVVEGKNVYANVDAVDGTVATLTLTDDVPTAPTIVVSTTEALTAAEQFVDTHDISMAGLTPTTATIDHGSYKEIRVDWELRVNGALVPNRVSLSVNPQTGHVFALTHISRPYDNPAKPVISLDQATAKAVSLVSGTAVSSDLLVMFDASGKQMLVWQLEVESKSAADLVWVDAVTGEAWIIGRG